MKKLLFFILGVVVFASCAKDEITPEKTIADNTNYSSIFSQVTLENNRLVFANEATFKNLLEVFQNDESAVHAFQSKFPNFTSSNDAFSAFNELTDAEFDKVNLDDYEDIIEVVEKRGEDRIVPEVDLVYPALITNTDGEIQVGDKIMKFTYSNIYRMDATEYPAFKNGEQVRSLETFPIDRNISNLRAIEADCDGYYTSSTRRFIGEVRNTNAVVYREIKVTTIHERKKIKRRKVVWRRENTNYIRLSGSVGHSSSANSLVVNTNVWKAQNNQSGVQKVVLAMALSPDKLIVNTVSVNHSIVGVDNTNHDCSTSK